MVDLILNLANLIACSNVHMKFRNYLPHDKQLQEGKLAPPVLPKFEEPVLAAPPPEEKNEVLHELNYMFLLYFTLSP